jgi:hypothetical protein
MQAWWWASVAIGWVCVVGCGGQPADAPGELTQRDAEPRGPNCTYGGVAIHRGIDQDRDFVLDDLEILETAYECNDTPPTLVRTDALAPDLTCPTGGTATRTGIDDNDDGVLEDAEIDQTEILCGAAETWRGDFAAADWMDPVKVAALRRARVVDGSLAIATTGVVALPLLELVHGDLLARGPMSALRVPALREIDGRVEVAAPIIELSFPALERIGGELLIERNAGFGSVISAPALRTLGGRLAFGADAHGTASLPRLGTVAALVVERLDELQLDALTSAGDVRISGLDRARLSLPALTTVAGTLRFDGNQGPQAIDLPVLAQVSNDLHLEGLFALRSLAMPALARVGGDLLLRATSLVALDLANLEEVGGELEIAALSLAAVRAPRLRSIGVGDASDASLSVTLTELEELELGQLTTIGGVISVHGNRDLRTVRFPALTTAKELSVRESSAVEVIAAPALASVEDLAFVALPALRTLDLSGLVEVTRTVFMLQCPLSDLSGLRSLASVGRISLTSVAGLQDFRDLSSLQQLRSLSLSDNPALTSLDGLESVRELFALSIRDQPVLTSMAGLRNVATVSASVAVHGNAMLPGIELTSLRSIGTGLSIADNPAMTSLSGLDTLTSVGGELIVSGNDRIPASELAAFRARLGR